MAEDSAIDPRSLADEAVRQIDGETSNNERRIHIPILEDTTKKSSVYEQAAKLREDFAREHVKGMDPDLRQDLSNWAKLELPLHRGTDSQGKRLDGEERRILEKTLKTYLQKIQEKYGLKDELDLQRFSRKNSLMREVKEELEKVA